MRSHRKWAKKASRVESKEINSRRARDMQWIQSLTIFTPVKASRRWREKRYKYRPVRMRR
jgi:hypothetical protein